MPLEISHVEFDENKMRSYLETHLKSHLTPDVSNYAKGRLRAWIGTEPPLYRGGEFKPGIHMPKFFERAQELLNWQFDYMLVTYSGEVSPVGITPHRDAGTLSYEAFGLGLVGKATFSYWAERATFVPGRAVNPMKPEDPPTRILEMVPGTLVRFNSKCLHSAVPEKGRWAANFWKKKE